MENKLTYSEFQEHLLQAVRQELKTQGSYQCELTHNQKNNVESAGLIIRQEDHVIAPVFYLEKAYQSFLAGMPLQQISRELVEAYQEQVLPEVDLPDLTDYEKIKDRLRVRLVNRENNQSYYKQGPYKLHPMGAEVLYIDLENQGTERMSIQVKTIMAERWGKPEAELFGTALENTQDHEKVSFCSMNEALQELLAEEPMVAPLEESPMYVLSNETRKFGATVLLYPEVAKQIRDKIGKDYYILPSSIHECIILPKEKGMLSVKELRDMVWEINQSQVLPEEVLGNEVYEFRDTVAKVKKCSKEERER
ncbi:DUF5688 family protein [Hespellia stercorisuis]|uniref:Uncharacterized protein n=1 Tax=Hespellia stercorisuis DSM 15480 TaxID=1121950 RepID=A0A1M6I5T8_9FIRM|nr:DUF5688 family protein [Hespellia stercorisuis]SHJ29803.1 hypothetical protein SAMN02745243_00239 [Hespellia stercorisuis DSM 15480]